MRIDIKSIHIENFLSIGSADIDLSVSGFVQVSGENRNASDSSTSNGTGKSSLFEAICWSLTGETIRGVKKVKNIFSDEGSLVTLKFSCDKDNYTITRTQDHSKYKTNLIILKNGEDVSGKGIRDSEAVLEKLLPDLNSQLIGSVIILGQGLPQRFTNNTPSGRKEVLEKLSKSDFMIEDLKTRVIGRKSVLSQNQADFTQSINMLKGKKQALESAILRDEEEYKRIPNDEDIKLQLDKIRQSIEDEQKSLSTVKGSYEKTRQHRWELNNKLSELKVKIENIENSVNMKYSGEASKISRKQQEAEINISNLTREINRIKSIKDVCPTCGQKIVGIVKPDTSKMEEELENNKTILEQCKNDISIQSATRDKEIKELSDVLEKEKTDLEDTVLDVLADEQVLDAKMSDLVDSINNHKNKEVSLTTRLGQIDTTRKSLEDRLKSEKTDLEKTSDEILYNSTEIEVINQHLDAVNKMYTSLTRDFRGILLTGIIEYLNKCAKQYCLQVFGNSEVEFCLDGNNLMILFKNKPYETLSGGEKQKIDIITQLSIRNMLCNYLDFSCNIICFDEIFDNCDSVGCQKILNLITSGMSDISGIYIITHHIDMDIPSDRVINVIKGENNISYIGVS